MKRLYALKDARFTLIILWMDKGPPSLKQDRKNTGGTAMYYEGFTVTKLLFNCHQGSSLQNSQTHFYFPDTEWVRTDG